MTNPANTPQRLSELRVEHPDWTETQIREYAMTELGAVLTEYDPKFIKAQTNAHGDEEFSPLSEDDYDELIAQAPAEGDDEAPPSRLTPEMEAHMTKLRTEAAEWRARQEPEGLTRQQVVERLLKTGDLIVGNSAPFEEFDVEDDAPRSFVQFENFEADELHIGGLVLHNVRATAVTFEG